MSDHIWDPFLEGLDLDEPDPQENLPLLDFTQTSNSPQFHDHGQLLPILDNVDNPQDTDQMDFDIDEILDSIHGHKNVDILRNNGIEDAYNLYKTIIPQLREFMFLYLQTISSNCRCRGDNNEEYPLSDIFRQYKSPTPETLTLMVDAIRKYITAGLRFVSITETPTITTPRTVALDMFIPLQDMVLMARRYAIQYLNVYKRVNGLPEYTFTEGAALLLNGTLLLEEVKRLRTKDIAMLWCDEFH